MIKGAIFDVDGTLLDSMHIWTNSGADFLRSIGVTPEEGLSALLFTMTVDEGAAYMKKRYNLDLSEEEIAEGINTSVDGFYINEADFKPGAREMLERAKSKGIPSVIASSTPRYCIEGALKRLGAMDYFDAILTCTEIGAGKSKPDIFHEALRILGTRPEETWLFEDGLYSMKTASALGIKLVGVYDKVSEANQAEMKELADIYITDYSQFTLF